MNNFAEFGIRIPEILLPKEKNMSLWSVIACDQYTQDANYWQSVANTVGNAPSTLNLILPEIYLSSTDKSERIKNIHKTMNDYLSNNVFDDEQNEFVYVERKTCYGRVRKGLVVALDLESYEWKPMSKALVRATEATIVERIPPRKEIRKGAAIESPHIMLLVNDSSKSLVEKTGELVKSKKPLYDTELMLNSGHVTGWAVSSEQEFDCVYNALSELKKANTFADGSAFLFAVGDGNHSLATAKAVWDEYKQELFAQGKTEQDTKNCAARYALVEIVNIYDDGLTFEPIHRVLFGYEVANLANYVQSKLGGTLKEYDSSQALDEAVKNSTASFGFVCKDKDDKTSYMCLQTDIKELAVSRLQPVLDDFVAEQNANKSDSVTIDYIHGSDEVFRLGQNKNAMSVLLPPVAKDSFFATISSRGPLPRKSFSMGEASEKRFYLECRKLTDNTL